MELEKVFISNIEFDKLSEDGLRNVYKLDDKATPEMHRAFEEYNRLIEEQHKEDNEEYKKTGIMF